MSITPNKIQISGRESETANTIAKILTKVRGRKITSSEAVKFVIKSIKDSSPKTEQLKKYLERKQIKTNR